MFKTVLPALPCYILYRTSIFNCCFSSKRCKVHAYTFLVLLLLLSVFHSFFRSPFFCFMGFFCICSRQGRTHSLTVAIMPLFVCVCRNAPIQPYMLCRHLLPLCDCKLSFVRSTRRNTGFHTRFLPARNLAS